MDDRAQKPLRIVEVAPPWFDVPPDGYGGIESMLASLTEALVARGHDVVLIGAGSDRTPATFRSTYEEPPSSRLGTPEPEVVHAAAVARHLDELEYDIVHDHSLAGPLTGVGRAAPTVVTVHGPVTGELATLYDQLGGSAHLVALSHAQRRTAPRLNWAGTVPNALDAADYPFCRDKDDYLVFLGRMSPDKGAHLAIEAARASGRRILLAGKCTEPAEQEYFAAEVEPLLGADAEFLGVADATRKKELLAGAQALVFPIQWEEPFGMVMIEAMACGTPVVALRRGAVPEVVVDGTTGYIRDDPADLPAAISAIAEISPDDCRRHVAENFSIDIMTGGYERIYRDLLAARSWSH